MQRTTRSLATALILFGQASCCLGQTELSRALKSKFNLKTVSCFTCHARKSEVAEDQRDAYKKHAKKFYNSFGELLREPLADKEITRRLGAVKKLKRDDPMRQKVVDEVVQEFLNVLEEVEAKEVEDKGVTYGELLKQGKLAGVKPR